MGRARCHERRTRRLQGQRPQRTTVERARTVRLRMPPTSARASVVSGRVSATTMQAIPTIATSQPIVGPARFAMNPLSRSRNRAGMCRDAGRPCRRRGRPRCARLGHRHRGWGRPSPHARGPRRDGGVLTVVEMVVRSSSALRAAERPRCGSPPCGAWHARRPGWSPSTRPGRSERQRGPRRAPR